MFEFIKNYFQKFGVFHYLVIFFAVALQIQVTLFSGDGYAGLRVSLADMALPIVGGGVLFSLLTKRSNWPCWAVRGMIFWLGALVLVMSVALLNGYVVNGALSSWAFVNKYIGVFLLLSYLMLGGWIIENSEDRQGILSLFVGSFVSVFVLIVAISAAFLFLQYFIPDGLWLARYPWDGLMANRNAYMVIFVLAFLFIIWSYRAGESVLIPLWVRHLFWVCLPIFLVFNDSRAGWLASVVLVVLFFVREPLKRVRAVVPVLLVGGVIAYGSYFVTTSQNVLKSQQMRYLVQFAKTDVSYVGDMKRYIAVEDGLELYRQHNPLIGAGLGSYKLFQIEKRGEFIDVIDFTGLWLLVETGAMGVFTFLSFFIVCAWALYRAGFVECGHSYYRAMLVFLIMFAAISVLHELMYMRVLWFSMGLALVKFGQGSVEDDWKRGASI